ncbi:MAG TPA: hypothetical protein VNM72_09525 [Blastocatellia bacterium]|nr:hypothetical protein [Blastocatellia bacterium]
MSEGWSWLIALALAVGVVALLVRDYRRKQTRTDEQYQADVRRAGVSWIGAAALSLHKLLQPGVEKAISYVQDEREGMTENDHDTGLDPRNGRR